MLLEPRRLKLSHYFDYEENDLHHLFTSVQPTTYNGLTFLDGARGVGTRFNFFRVLSEFYKNAFLSEVDLGDVDTSRAAPYSLLSSLAQSWAVTGEFCISTFREVTGGTGSDGQPLAIDGLARVRSVRPDFVHPVYSPFSRDDIERLLIIYPEVDRSLVGNQTNVPASAKTALVYDYNLQSGECYQSTRQYSLGSVADGPLGELVPGLSFELFQLESSPYEAIETITREICVRLNILQSAFNNTSIPILEINTDSLVRLWDALKDVGQGARASVTTEMGQEYGFGLIAKRNFDSEPPARYVERSGISLQESLQYLTMLMSQLGIQTGLPDYVFASRVGQKMVESESMLFQAKGKLRAFKHTVKSALAARGLTVEYGTDSFTSQATNIDNTIKLVDAGLMSAEEAKKLLL